MSRNLAVVAVLAAFFLGCSAGIVGGVMLSRFAMPGPPGWRQGPPHDGPRGRGPGREGMVVDRLAKALDLTDTQRTRIEQLFERARRDHAAVRDSVHAAIERELTPEQLRRWKEIESRFNRPPRGRALPPPGEGERP